MLSATAKVEATLKRTLPMMTPLEVEKLLSYMEGLEAFKLLEPAITSPRTGREEALWDAKNSTTAQITR